MTKNTSNNLKITSIVFACIAVALLIAGFICPPLAVIHPSVLTGTGEIMGIIALFMGWEAIDRGIDTKITHNNTTVEFENDSKLDNNEDKNEE